MVEIITQEVCDCCGKTFSATHDHKLFRAPKRDYVGPLAAVGSFAGAVGGAALVYKSRNLNNGVGTGFKLGWGMFIGAAIFSLVGETVTRPLGGVLQEVLPQPKPRTIYCCDKCVEFYQENGDGLD